MKITRIAIAQETSALNNNKAQCNCGDKHNNKEYKRQNIEETDEFIKSDPDELTIEDITYKRPLK